jgi:hypothetical protein
MIAERILKWMLSAQETLDSQAFLLAVFAEKSDLRSISRPDVLSICCNLVVYDEFTDVFRFAHLSVREYLETSSRAAGYQ